MNNGALQEISENRRQQLTADEKCNILIMNERGTSITNIANEFRRDIKTIRNVINNWFERGTNKRKVGSGRRRKTTQEEDAQLIRYSQLHNFQKRQEVLNATNVEISKATLTRRLKGSNLKRYIAAKKPHLTDEIIDERFDYALNYSNWTNTECNRIVCMDECSVNTQPNGTVRVTRKRGERYEQENIDASQYPGKISVPIHAWISSSGIGTVTRIEGNMNSQKYIAILTEELPKIDEQFGGRNWNLVHDRSTIHMSRATSVFIRENGINDMQHPRKSPDLNPIENVFAELKRRINNRIREEGRIRTADQLFEWIKYAWIQIGNTNFVHNCYVTFPHRFYEVTNRHGHHSSY
ncbi:hypothetical protein B4U80_13334 [Leptotrombidium deliense]|uniref:Transposase-like protein n=1 Tax=Leptotrombidium deliense TaxID=299467 RepID=A0A443S854_9ACAR|nr:hypothetical protein B4U80_13334 [Leptotrombidium deliense]